MFSFTAHLAKPEEFPPKTPRNDERITEHSGTLLAALGSLELRCLCPYSTTPVRSIPKSRCLKDKPSRSHSTHAASKTLFYPRTFLRQELPVFIFLRAQAPRARGMRLRQSPAAEQGRGMRPERSGHRSAAAELPGQQRPSAASTAGASPGASLPPRTQIPPAMPQRPRRQLGGAHPFFPISGREGSRSISPTPRLPGELEPFH